MKRGDLMRKNDEACGKRSDTRLNGKKGLIKLIFDTTQAGKILYIYLTFLLMSEHDMMLMNIL